MQILTDKDLRTKIGGSTPTLVLDIETGNLNNQVRGCAVDLLIGDIFRPGTSENNVGSASKPRKSYCLKEGETAVIRTLEKFKLDAEHCAIVFPASSVSIKGLLMTNPGHIDPGYEGHLHVTVINMARETYQLERGQRFLRTILFKLDNAVLSPSTLKDQNPIDSELLTRLSPDFMSVNTRVKKEIQKAELRARFFQAILPILAAIGASILTVWQSNDSVTKDFSGRIDKLEQIKIETRLVTLENNVQVEKRINAIEDKLRALPSSGPSK